MRQLSYGLRDQGNLQEGSDHFQKLVSPVPMLTCEPD